MKKIVLISGGARSGKSRQALHIGRDFKTKAFIATAQAFDAEMAARIEKHRLERAPSFTTYESPVALSETLQCQARDFDFVLIDCITLWLSNLFMVELNASEIEKRIDVLCSALRDHSGTCVVVTNEIGMGIVPDNPLSRTFRDMQGTANQKLAAAADEVLFMVAGLPLYAKQINNEVYRP
jgi:adenosylcobinamide kinase / adenosylcobinamide-phosphate guanylyltransferase